MKKLLKLISFAAVGAGLLAVPSLAHAQKLTLRVEPGVAVPLTNPQADRFHPGGSLVLKPELTLFSWVGVGPSAQFMALPSRVDGVSTGTAWSFGGFVRVKRPHDERNTGHGLSAISPWIDGDLKYNRTDQLNRFGASVAVGAQVPTSDSRWLWVGPFVRYDLVNQEGGKVGLNTNSAKTLIMGVSFEFGAPVKKKGPATSIPAGHTTVVGNQPAPLPLEPKPVVSVHLEEEEIEIKQVVQFDFASSKINPTADKQLSEVLAKLTEAAGFKAIRVEGHASSDGNAKRNEKLALKRATSVLEWLVAHGVPREALTAQGFGFSVPVASNDTQEGRVKNRRTEFTVRLVVIREVVVEESK